MNAQEALKLGQAYLDGQLDPATRAAVEEVLASDPSVARTFEAQRAYLAFIKRVSAAPAPADVKERLARKIAGFAPRTELRLPAHSGRASSAIPIGRPDLETDRISSEEFRAKYRPRRMPIGSRPLAMAASVMLGLAGIVLYQSVCLTGQCPYINAASVEYQNLERSQDQLGLMSSDPVRLTRFVDDNFHLDLPAIPTLTRCTFKPKGASCAKFDSLRKFRPDTPPAAAICYKCEGFGMIALMLHPVAPERTPSAYTRTDFNGKEYFVDEQNGYRAVCWKTRNGKLLCSIVGKASAAELLEVAEEARAQIDQ